MHLVLFVRLGATPCQTIAPLALRDHAAMDLHSEYPLDIYSTTWSPSVLGGKGGQNLCAKTDVHNIITKYEL